MVGEKVTPSLGESSLNCFSLVAEIGWLASTPNRVYCRRSSRVSVSLPRLGGWRVVEPFRIGEDLFSFSLVAEIGWLASGHGHGQHERHGRFSLVAEIGWLASHSA